MGRIHPKYSEFVIIPKVIEFSDGFIFRKLVDDRIDNILDVPAQITVYLLALGRLQLI